MAEKVLLIEDEDRLRRILKLVIEEAGYEIRTAAEGGKGIELWQNWQPHVVLTDLKMQPVDGMAVLRYGVKHHPHTPCIILTAFGTVAKAVDAMKSGAYDFLTKPVDHSQLLDILRNVMAQRSQGNRRDDALIGSSEAMQAVKREIELVASTDSAVLIQGESGTGKELVARAIHAASARSKGPFVRINCASIPSDLLESELFGHCRGAFTGATTDRRGVFVRAHGGVLFLDEIGDLPLALQPKLLHAVEEKEISPVGGSRTQLVSVKILSATNISLEEMVRKKRFRADLFYRLNTMVVTLPPLRDRGEDIRLLAIHFLTRFSSELGRRPPAVSPPVLEILNAYPWPGNVRELRNAMERAALVCTGDVLEPDHLPPSIREPRATCPQSDEACLDLVAREQALLRAALEQCNWNQTRAARKLNITRSALRYRLKKYGIGGSK